MNYSKYQFTVPSEKKCRLICDTDAFNEADDQFAIVQAMLSPKIENVAFVAAHYGLKRHQDSMERSFDELHRVFAAADCPFDDIIVKGAPHPLTDTREPLVSEGAKVIVEEAMKDDFRPLYVIFLGPLTDLACAYLMEPRIAGRLTAIWIGGGTYPKGGIEFNLGNDIIAANIIMDSAIDLWQVPKNVYEMMSVSFAELQYKVATQGKLGAYLFQQLLDHTLQDAPRKSKFRTGETWVLGDSPAVGLILYEHRFECDMISAPHIHADMTYELTDRERKIRVYRHIDSRLILDDLFAKLALFDPQGWDSVSQ